MVTTLNLYLAFCWIAVTKESLQVEVRNSVWAWILQLPQYIYIYIIFNSTIKNGAGANICHMRQIKFLCFMNSIFSERIRNLSECQRHSVRMLHVLRHRSLAPFLVIASICLPHLEATLVLLDIASQAM
jgi:hypothetical protein